MKTFLIVIVYIFPLLSMAQVSQNDIKFNQAQDLLYYGEDAKAAAVLRDILKSDSTYAKAYVLLADIYIANEKQNGLSELYAKASRIIGKEYPEFRLLYANSLYSQGKIDDALVQYENFLKVEKPGTENAINASWMLGKCRTSNELRKKPVPFKPVNMGEMINSADDEYLPSFSIDRSILFITRRMPGGTDPVTGQDVNDEDFFYSVRQPDGSWSKAKGVPGLNTRGNEGAHCLSADGNTLVFTACSRYDSYGACDLYISRKRGSDWTTPVNMGSYVNSGSWDSQPSLSSDGKSLYFTSNRSGGKGGTDIWMSTLNSAGRWETPVNLGDSVNSSENEISPFIHSDGVTLYFASKGHPGVGNYDIFMSKKSENVWSVPVNLGYPINTELDDMSMMVDASGKTAYFASVRSEGYGKQDIYYFELYPEVRAANVTWIKGIIKDAVSGSFLRGDVDLFHIQSGTHVYSGTAETDGSFLACFSQDGDFAVNVSYKGYLMYSGNFNVSGDHTKTPFTKEIAMQPVTSGSSMNLNNIFFDSDSYTLKEQSNFELEKLYTFLVNNPTVKIKIAGHTDDQGSAEHNSALSKQRAEVVMNYLLTKGIQPLRITTEGFGSSRPVADNTTPEGRALNRRTEIIITSLK